METINYVKTSGQFGRKRALPTFIIESFQTDLGVTKYKVTDERNLERGSCGTFLTLQDAIKAFKPYAERRTRLF